MQRADLGKLETSECMFDCYVKIQEVEDQISFFELGFGNHQHGFLYQRVFQWKCREPLAEVHILLKLQKHLLMKVKCMGKQPVQSPHYCNQTLSFADGDPALEIFDIEQNRGSLVQIMHHIVYCWAIGSDFVCSTQEFRLLWALHRGTASTSTEIFEGSGKQIQLQYKLPHVLVFPDVQINACRFFYDFLDVGRVEPYISSEVLMSSWMYYWTAKGPVIFRMSSTYQDHSSLFLLPILFLLKLCIQILLLTSEFAKCWNTNRIIKWIKFIGLNAIFIKHVRFSYKSTSVKKICLIQGSYRDERAPIEMKGQVRLCIYRS